MSITRNPDKQVSLYLNLTNACNSACVFCVSSSQNVPVRRDVPFENILDAFQKLHIGPGDEIVVNGGEPTIYRDLGELIKRGAARGGQIYLCTNGRLLHRYENARILLASGVSRLSIPLHGFNSETHDDLTCRVGSLEQTLIGLKNAYAIRSETGYPDKIEIKLLSLHSVLPEWSSIIDHIVQEFGNPDYLVLSGLNMWSTATVTYDQVTPSFENMRYYINVALERAKHHRINIILWAIPLCMLNPEHLKQFMSSACSNSSGVHEGVQSFYFDPDCPAGIELPSNEFDEATAQMPCQDCNMLEPCGPGSTFMQQIIATSN